jgi:hypothetical protein
MAHEWYVQHNGKLYGPLSSANLKKLAAEGRISAATNVRLGAEGNWVPAARVQGLFVASSAEAPPVTGPAAKSPPPKTAPPREHLTPPPIAPPIAPQVAAPVARMPVGSFVPKAQPAAAAAGSMAAKILGAVSLVLGILALATFWLPMLGALGWMGIGVGSLGLILGIAGFVISARKQGSGLALNIAGTSSSVVGLVLTVVFGVMFGLFGSKPSPPIVAVLPTPPPVVVAPEPEPEPEAPAPPPEPVWTDASQAIEQGPIKASIASAKIEQVRIESADLSTLKKSKPQPMLKVVVTIVNTSVDRIVEVPGWPGGGDLVGTGVSELLGSDAGKALQTATATAKLNDNTGNAYKQVALMSLFGAQLPSGDHAVRPGKSKQLELVFPPPLDTIEYLRIELSAAGFSGTEPLRFQIPKEMIAGMAAPTSP